MFDHLKGIKIERFTRGKSSNNLHYHNTAFLSGLTYAKSSLHIADIIS